MCRTLEAVRAALGPAGSVHHEAAVLEAQEETRAASVSDNGNLSLDMGSRYRTKQPCSFALQTPSSIVHAMTGGGRTHAGNRYGMTGIMFGQTESSETAPPGVDDLCAEYVHGSGAALQEARQRSEVVRPSKSSTASSIGHVRVGRKRLESSGCGSKEGT